MKQKQQRKPKISPGQFKALVNIYYSKQDSVSIDIKNTLIKKGFLNDRLYLTEKSYILLRKRNVISGYALMKEQKFFSFIREKFPSSGQLFTKKL